MFPWCIFSIFPLCDIFWQVCYLHIKKEQNEGEKASFSCVPCHILEANHNNARFCKKTNK